MKDWAGNKNSIYKTLGASNHTDKEREVNDYYASHTTAHHWKNGCSIIKRRMNYD